MESNTIWLIFIAILLGLVSNSISQLRNDIRRMKKTIEDIAKQVGVQLNSSCKSINKYNKI